MITLDGVTHRYGDAVAVDELTLELPRGEWTLLVGPNGSGKTTLVRHCNGLLHPDAGTVAVDGRDVAEEPVYARTNVGMVFQHPRDQFVAATVGADVAFGPENLGLDRGAVDRRVTEALAAVDMADRRTARIESLSGGEAARVAVAGALAMEPDYLVLDEPLVGLDFTARQSLLAYLDDVAHDTGILLVTHDLRDLVSRADRLLAMVDGRVAADADPTDAASALEGIPVRVPRC